MQAKMSAKNGTALCYGVLLMFYIKKIMTSALFVFDLWAM